MIAQPSSPSMTLGTGDALVVVDVQNDFLPGGSLAVPQGDVVIPVLNEYLGLFIAKGLPIVATRDWHPPRHVSFNAQGGPWPAHCVAGSRGAEFAQGLALPSSVRIVSKGTAPDRDAYSGFQGTDLKERLRRLGVQRLFIGGLATDYCVLHTVKDARAAGFDVCLLQDAIRAVNVHPADGRKAEEDMVRLGAVTIRLRELADAP